MAQDNLSQLGRNLNTDKKDVNHVTRRIAENFPLVERTRDEMGHGFPFHSEFYVYTTNHKHTVLLDLKLNDFFDPNSLVSYTNIPITFPTDGSLGVWYPLAYFGDLNFETGSSYSVIFTKISTGSFSMSFKVSHNLGEVDVTGLVTITTGEILVPLTYSNLVSPPTLIIKDVYVWGRVDSLSGTLALTAATLFENGYLYTPRKISV